MFRGHPFVRLPWLNRKLLCALSPLNKITQTLKSGKYMFTGMTDTLLTVMFTYFFYKHQSVLYLSLFYSQIICKLHQLSYTLSTQ